MNAKRGQPNLPVNLLVQGWPCLIVGAGAVAARKVKALLAAGRTTLEILKRDSPYPQLDRLGARLETGLRDVTAKRNAPLCVSRRGGMFTVHMIRAHRCVERSHVRGLDVSAEASNSNSKSSSGRQTSACASATDKFPAVYSRMHRCTVAASSARL